MGDVLPLRFGGGGVRALVAPMVACVASVSAHSYRTATASKGQRIRVIPSNRWFASCSARQTNSEAVAKLHPNRVSRS